MRNLRAVFYYLGVILIAFSVLQAAPLAVSAFYKETVQFPVRIYAIPAIISLGIGLALVLLLKARPITGRLAMAVGRAGVPFSPSNLSLGMNGFSIFEKGRPVEFDEPALTKTLAREEILVEIRVGPGKGEAEVWTCDLTHEYISINADYRT